jgi:hypothetical protein
LSYTVAMLRPIAAMKPLIRSDPELLLHLISILSYLLLYVFDILHERLNTSSLLKGYVFLQGFRPRAPASKCVLLLPKHLRRRPSSSQEHPLDSVCMRPSTLLLLAIGISSWQTATPRRPWCAPIMFVPVHIPF